MPLLNSASKLYLGTTPVKAAYRGAVLVWPPGSGNRLYASLALKSGSTVTLTTSWTGEDPTSYKIWISLNGGAWSYWTEKTAAGSFDYTTTYSTRIKMKVEAYYAEFSPDLQAYTNEVTTGAAPPPATITKTIDIAATHSASYNGSNQNRNVNECYYGYYSSTNGLQKSLWYWPIPAEVRNCIRIDRIDVQVYNIHSYLASGGSVGLVVHHGNYWSGFPAVYPGSTRILTYNGSNFMVPTPKPGYLSQAGTAWMTNLEVLMAPGRTTLGEEFRVNNAWGMGLAAPSTSTNHYGYAGGAAHPAGQKPVLRITYTIYA